MNQVKFELTSGLYNDIEFYKKFLLRNIVDMTLKDRKLHNEYHFGNHEEFYDRSNEYLDRLIKIINNETNSKLKKISHEDLRKTAIIGMVDANVEIALLSKISGNDIATLSQYYNKKYNLIKVKDLSKVNYFNFI